MCIRDRGKSAGAIITIIPEEFKTKEVRLQHVVDLLVGSIVKRKMCIRDRKKTSKKH